MKKVIRISLLILLTFLLVSCKSININENNENNDTTISEKSEKIITEYLDNTIIGYDISEGGKKCYTAFEVLGIRDNKIYLWMHKEAIAAMSSPIVLNVENIDDDEIIITSHEVPRDGPLYSEDMKKLFPKGILPEPEEHNDMVSRLGKIIEDKRSLE